MKTERTSSGTEARSDVVIVGGGPAGSLAAWLLAGAGFSVTLVEAQAVLGERVCGAYLCPAGVALLEELGLRGLTDRARTLHGMVMVAPSQRSLRAHFPDGGRFPGVGLALRRPEFDQALLRAAAGRGAKIRMGRRMTGVRPGTGGWAVDLDDGSTVCARLLIGADGRKSRVARHLGLARDPWQERVAMHVDVLTLVPTEPFGEMHVFEDGTYIGLNPIGPSTMNVSALGDPEVLKRTPPLEFLNERIQRSESLRRRLPRLDERSRLGTTFPAAATVSGVVARRAALIGDAGGFLDPLTGEGIYQALWTARALAEAVSAGGLDEKAVGTALARYARERRRQFRGKRWMCRTFQTIIRRPAWCEAVYDTLTVRQEVGDAFMGIIGNIYTPLQGGWRMMRAVTSL